MLKGVLFDLGSTLQEFRVEDWAAIDRELNADLHTYLLSRGHGHRLPPIDEFVELLSTTTRARWTDARSTLRGKSLLDLLEPMFQQYGMQGVRPEECLLPWYGRMTDRIYIEPDVKPTLGMLRGSGLKLGLVSNTAWPSGAHDPDLERFGIKDLLEPRLYSCEVGWEKPAPQIFHEALDRAGLRPEETAFVGDFLRYDIAGAQGVGMKGIWKRMKERPLEADDHTVVPDATIERIGELPGALEKLYGWHSA